MEERIHRIIALKDCPRLDKFVAESMEGISRSLARSLIKQGRVTLEGRHVKHTHPVSRGEKVEVNVPPETSHAILPENLPVNFIHIDDAIAVVNKPAGMVVHPAAGNRTRTLVNALLYHLGPMPAEGQGDRPGVVHRLDKDTSGLLVTARTMESLRSLQSQFAARTVEKEYMAITSGVPGSKTGLITLAIGRHETKRKKMAAKREGGRAAQTRYEVLEDYSTHALVRLMPLTGRTHQIRVHLKSLGTPVLCDSKYSKKGIVRKSELLGQGKKKGEKPVLARQALHACRLSFDHPETGERTIFEAPVPGDMKAVLDLLRAKP